jgi:hypothetical protein
VELYQRRKHTWHLNITAKLAKIMFHFLSYVYRQYYVVYADCCVFVIKRFFINTYFGSAFGSITPKIPQVFKNVPRRGYTLIYADIHPQIS